MDNTADIPRRLKLWSVKTGLRQSDIAERLGKSVTYVSDLMNGRCRFGRQTAHAWNEAFGIDENWLLTGEGDMFGDATTDGVVANTVSPDGAYCGGVCAEIDMMRRMLDGMLLMQQDMRERYSELRGMYDELRTMLEQHSATSAELLANAEKRITQQLTLLMAENDRHAGEILRKCSLSTREQDYKRRTNNDD